MSEETKIDPKHLRQVASRFATGITIVAVTNGNDVRGMTANSFLCVSLEPPLVLFSIQESGSLLPHIQLNTRLGISVLGEAQQDYSQHFAGEPDLNLEPSFTSRDGAPILSPALAWFASEVTDIIPCGDHKLVICRVISCHREDGEPLVYFSGYRKLMSPS